LHLLSGSLTNTNGFFGYALRVSRLSHDFSRCSAVGPASHHICKYIFGGIMITTLTGRQWRKRWYRPQLDGAHSIRIAGQTRRGLK